MQLHKRLSWQTVNQLLSGFASKQISAQDACRLLGISRSRLYALCERWRSLHPSQKQNSDWLYQRSNTSDRFSTAQRAFLEEELLYLKNESPFFKGHFNFAALADQCHKLWGKRFHRNTLRRWAVSQGFYDPKTDSTGKPFIRFEMGAIGILFQHDSSHHVWLPHTKRTDVLIATEDDHSRKIVGALLVPADTAWHHLEVVRNTLETFGRPVAYYTDNHGIFRPRMSEEVPSPGCVKKNGRAEIKDHATQFSRALADLKIALKFTAKAHPQAKGKIEKRFDYLQRRIPQLCERYKITSLFRANQILKEVVDFYNSSHIHAETQQIPDQRWAQAIKDGRSLLTALPNDLNLDHIFALRYERYVRNDGTISFSGKAWKVPNAPLRRTVLVILRPPYGSFKHTQLWVLYKGSTLAHFVLDPFQKLDPDHKVHPA